MVLSQNEQEELLEFIKSKYVDYQDIRILIAKDMEVSIKKLMKDENPPTFKKAVEITYKNYGVLGFSDVTETYMKEINSYYLKKVVSRLLITELKTLNFWALSILIFSLFFFSIKTLSSMPLVLAGAYLTFIIVGLILYAKKIRRITQKLQKQNKYFYFDYILQTNNSMLFPISYTPLLLAPNLGRLVSSEVWHTLILAFLVTLSVLAFYFIIFKIHKNRNKLLKTYEEEFLNAQTYLCLKLT